MPKSANQLPKGGKANATPPPTRGRAPLYLAAGALLIVITGVTWLAINGRGSTSTGNPAQVAGQPALVVDQQKIDFGKVPLDIPVKATFQLSNAGDQPLQILNQPVVEVKQGC